jgi:hypothetical protein
MKLSELAQFLFDHPEHCPEWYLEEGFSIPNWSPGEIVLNATRLFADIGAYADRFTEGQLCSGLEYLINPSCGDVCYSFLDEAVGDSDRVAALASMYEVFNVVFRPRCTSAVSHNATSPIRPYNRICYMWWDVFPRHGIPARTAFNSLDKAILDTLEKILWLDSIPCKESALHGLGHWHVGNPMSVEGVIDRGEPQIPEILKRYAASAKVGSVQ